MHVIDKDVSACAVEIDGHRLGRGPVLAVTDYQSEWSTLFFEESQAIAAACKDGRFYVDHVGSTSIPGLAAKPIVDILVSAADISVIERVSENLKALGYTLSEVCQEVPRHFLIKYSCAGNFHVHVCSSESAWYRGMVDFKHELLRDSEFSRKYSELKKKLVKSSSGDFNLYAKGKKDFIERRLDLLNTEFSVSRLLAHQKAESDRARRLQIKAFICQAAVALIAALSVFISDHRALYGAALVGALVTIVWALTSRKQKRHRSISDQARRAVLLMGGLGIDLSPSYKIIMADQFTASVPESVGCLEGEQFSSRTSPGCKRVCEMIEESSYWMRDLQRSSAKATGILLALLVGGSAALCLTVVAASDAESTLLAARSMIAVMIFSLSSDVLGQFLAHRAAAVQIDEIFKRVALTSRHGHSEPDTLLLMSDYNVAIDSAPLSPPWTFGRRHKELSRLWRAYVREKMKM